MTEKYVSGGERVKQPHTHFLNVSVIRQLHMSPSFIMNSYTHSVAT